MTKKKPRRQIDKKLKKELQQPDEFVTWVARINHYAEEHMPVVITAIVGLFVTVAVVSGAVAWARKAAEERRGAAYTTVKEVTTAISRDSERQAALARLDDLISDTGNKAQRARLYMVKGELLMEADDAAAAAEAFEGALAHGGGLTRDLATMALASAKLESGDPEAAATHLQGVDGPLAEAATVERIRLALAADNLGEARSLVNGLEVDNPESPVLSTARALLEASGAVPEDTDAPEGQENPAGE